ncbi:MAG TPA: hypothetical protein VJ692_04625 [Nitrospiraceae bacterium]|nr:hypothetical protein [Nitrospiraceae bacterium]
MRAFLTKYLWSLTVVIALVLGAGDGLGQTGALNKDPSKLLKKYLSLDMRGARLEAISWESQKPYIDWVEEPVWGRVVVVTAYEVMEDLEQWDVKDNLDVVIPVEFKVLGSVYLDQATFLAEAQVERIGFRIKAVRGYWRIVEPLIPPHVGYKRMMNFVRQAIVEETEPSRVAALSTLKDELRRAQ